MQNLTRELAHLAASKGGRIDWNTRQHLPQGYEVWMPGGRDGARYFRHINTRCVEASRHGDVVLTLWRGATSLGTVSIDGQTFRSLDWEVATRALLATLWAGSH